MTAVRVAMGVVDEPAAGIVDVRAADLDVFSLG
jgi:hypothetical protein